MKRMKNLLLIILQIVIITAVDIIGQQHDEFLVGSFIQSSDNLKITQLSNYGQIDSLGLNAVFQLARKLPENPDSTNLDELSNFKYVYLVNDSGYGNPANELGAKDPRNIDWISYFTHAKYRKWEAEGDSLFNGRIKIKYESGSGEIVPDGDVTVFATNGQSSPEDTIIKGPHYWQYPHYTWTNGDNPTPINYIADFRLRIDEPSQEILPVCSLFVTMLRKNNNVWEEIVLGSKLLTTEDLSENYSNFSVPYNYIGYYDQSQGPFNNPSPPGELRYKNPSSYNIYSAVQYKVQWLGNRELFVDYIEVYDDRIWKEWFKQDLQGVHDSILHYDNFFKNHNNFYNSLSYYGTQDEPHSIDCYEPLRRVQFILDSLNIKADLLSHWYPEWNGHWLGNSDEDFTWNFYGQLAQPKKIMFWYAPFGVTNGVDDDNNFTLYHLQLNLQWAHLQKPDFYVTLQSWGTSINGVYPIYRTPTPNELSAETMLTLAHGAKGIFYEHYYSYTSSYGKFQEGLVGTVGQGFTPTPNWFRVKEIATRLKGTLGNTLMKLKYDANIITPGYLQLRRKVHVETNETVTYRYLTLSTINGESQPEKINFHAGFLMDSSSIVDRYFLLTNQLTTNESEVRIEVNNNFSSLKNYRITDLEDEGNINSSFISSITFDQTISAGDGKLFKTSPLVKCGGTLMVNDTITSDISLEDNLTIPNGITLAVNNSVYTIDDTITLQGTGFISGDGFINLTSNGKVIINSFQRGLFKSVSGVHPKLVWEYPPELSSVEVFKIYRKREEEEFEPIAEVESNLFSYTDEEVTVLIGQPVPSESYVEYYIKAYGMIEEEYQTAINSNEVRYRIDRDMQKQLSEGETIKYKYELSNNYPNPFNPTTIIKYELAEKGFTTLKVFNILGKEVVRLVNEEKMPGVYEVEFNANNLPSGIYIYRLTSNKFTSTKKFVLMK